MNSIIGTLGHILALYEDQNKEEAKKLIKLLVENDLPSNVKGLVFAIDDLFENNRELNPTTFQQDVRTIEHYKKEFEEKKTRFKRILSDFQKASEDHKQFLDQLETKKIKLENNNGF